MKILVLQDHLRSGGTERQSILLAHAFAAAGHATTLLTFRPGGALADTVAPTVTRHTLQSFDTRLDWFAPGLFTAVRQLAPDVILCMGRMANCYAAGLQQQHPTTAVVCTMRTGKPLPWPYRRSLRTAHHIVANSRDARDHLVARYHVPADKITVIHNSLVFPATSGSQLSALSSQLSASVSQLSTLNSQPGRASGPFILLNVAMFRPEKNQRELIEIAATLPPSLDWQLWLAGDGPARTGCEALATAKSLTARVKFLGLVRDPTPLYAAADVAVHASTSESLSNFLIEAQARGLPVVATEAQGNRECFIPDRTGWAIAPGDRPAFRAALERLAAATPEERTALAAAARAHARDTFDPARQVEKYLTLFQRLKVDGDLRAPSVRG